MGPLIRSIWRRWFGPAAADDLDRPVLDRIKSRWASEGVTIRPGNSTESLAAFGSRYGVVLPPAVRDYFVAVDGTGDDTDNELLRFWPLAEVVPIAEEYGKAPAEMPEVEHWFLFADFLIDSHRYAVRLTPDPADGGAVATVDGTDLILQAPTFESFLERYLVDRKNLSLHIPPPDRRWLARDDEVGPR